MLVVKIKPGDRIHIGENVTVSVRKIGGGKLSLGIVAPGIEVSREAAVKLPADRYEGFAAQDRNI